MSQIRSLYRALFRRSANIYVSKLRFAVFWLGQIHNLDTGHVYVLGLKSGSEPSQYSRFCLCVCLFCRNAYTGRRTKFASVKSLDSWEFSSEFSDLKTLSSNIKVKPVISWNGHHRIFPSNSQDFTTTQIFFEFSGFDYTPNSFLIKPLHANDRKTCPFREILSQWKGRGEDRVE